MNYFIGDTEQLITNNMILCTAPNPSSVRNNQATRSGTNVLATIFLIVNATLGAGLLNFPQAFDRAGGLVTSISMQLLLLIFITAALVVLAQSSNVANTSSMQDTLAEFCGSKSLYLCAFSITIYSFGCCLTFLIVIGDQFDRVLATYYGLDYCHTWYLSRPFVTAVICSVFVLPLCFFKRLDVLSYASSIGCITVLYVVCIIIYKNFAKDETPINPMKMWPENGLEALQIIPIICFAYQSHMTAIPMYACMKERNLEKFTFCAVVSMIICFIAYTAVGICGYATFGAGKVPSDILQGYADKTITLTLAILFIAVKNFTTYPIVLYCGRDALLGLLGMDTDVPIKVRVLVSLVWYIMTLIIAVLVPDISPVINLLGTLSAAFIFIIPGICLLQSTLLKGSEVLLHKDQLLILFAVLLITLGAFISGVVFIEGIQDLNKPPKITPLVTGFRQLRENLCT